MQRQSSRARRHVFRLANYEIRIELKISRVQKKICTKMFVQNPRALTSSNRFDAVSCNANYVNASFFNNLLCPACRKMHLYIHFVQKHTISSAPFYKLFTAASPVRCFHWSTTSRHSSPLQFIAQLHVRRFEWPLLDTVHAALPAVQLPPLRSPLRLTHSCASLEPWLQSSLFAFAHRTPLNPTATCDLSSVLPSLESVP